MVHVLVAIHVHVIRELVFDVHEVLGREIGLLCNAALWGSWVSPFPVFLDHWALRAPALDDARHLVERPLVLARHLSAPRQTGPARAVISVWALAHWGGLPSQDRHPCPAAPWLTLQESGRGYDDTSHLGVVASPVLATPAATRPSYHQVAGPLGP